MFLEDKDTSSGRDKRDYRCRSCGNSVVEDRGVALWQVLHDANQETAELARKRAGKRWWRFWAR